LTEQRRFLETKRDLDAVAAKTKEKGGSWLLDQFARLSEKEMKEITFMKRGTLIFIALVVSVLSVSLIASVPAFTAAPPRTFAADTGVITLGPDQVLRMTVANGSDTARIGFTRLEYDGGSCVEGVCKYLVASRISSDPTFLAPGEGAAFQTNGSSGLGPRIVRGVVTSNSQNVNVNAMIINSTTGEVQGIIAILIG
jgi:hypothetical protein